MFEDFSTGYYLGRLYVQPYDGQSAVIEQSRHEQMNKELYASGEGIERIDNPLIMKLDSTHFPVQGADDISEGTLGLPQSILDATRISHPPELKEVFLAKSDRAQQLMQLCTVQ
ncbi:MAG: DUF5802 family protein [Halobacteriaceae archaeon]